MMTNSLHQLPACTDQVGTRTFQAFVSGLLLFNVLLLDNTYCELDYSSLNKYDLTPDIYYYVQHIM